MTSVLQNLLRRGLRALDSNAVPSSVPLTDEQLKALSEDAIEISRWMEQPGFKIFRDRIKREQQAERDRLIEMKATDFQGPMGLEQKGFCKGMIYAVNQVVFIIEEGVEADKQLRARQTEKKEQIKRVVPVGQP